MNLALKFRKIVALRRL